MLAKCAESFLNQMSDNELMHHPCLEQFDYPSPNKFPKTVLIAGELTQTLHWQTDREKINASLPLTDLLYTDPFEDYCQAPFKEDNIANFMEKLEVPGVLNEKKMIKSHSSHRFSSRINQWQEMQVWERNNVLLLKW